MSNAARAGNSEAPAVTLIAHPPERRQRRARVPAQAGHCCSCCCCCLHSLGALIGAAVAPALGGPRPDLYLPLTDYWDEEDFDRPASLASRDREAVMTDALSPLPPPAEADLVRERHERNLGIALPALGFSAVSLFWWILLILVIGGLVLSTMGGRGEGLLVGGVIMLLVFPGLQLAAAAFTALILGVSYRPDKGHQFRQLGKIVLGMVAGTVLGILLMVGIYFAAVAFGVAGFAAGTIIGIIAVVALPVMLRSLARGGLRNPPYS